MMAIAFLGYVLPYGQMSLWGATVITNLMSAIPWVGQDIVELTNFCLQQWKPESDILFNSLPVIGITHANAHRKLKNVIKPLENEFMVIPPSFIAFFVGLVDGDGYIQVTKTTKGFITIKLVISLHLNDIATLEYLKSILKIGIVSIYKDNTNPSCKYIINRTDLQTIIFPLMLYHNIFFLTKTRVEQFNLAMYIFKENVKLYSLIENRKDIPVVFIQPKTAVGYINLPFFKNWVVGFVLAEGSFFMKINNDGCFQIKQRIHINMFECFKLLFETNRAIYYEKDLYCQFNVSSKGDIQKVINFFSFSGLHPLVGLKYIQYIMWLQNLRASKRYHSLNFPENL